MTKRPRYLDLAADMRRQITDGAWGLGDQLPTEHQLCAQHGIEVREGRFFDTGRPISDDPNLNAELAIYRLGMINAA